MWKSAVFVVALTASYVLAQVHGGQTRPRRPFPNRTLSARAMSGPTIVTGEGMTMPSGLKYWDIKIGTGATATKGKPVKIHYTGWLESGRKFDSSVDTGQPVIFMLGAGQVIKAWDEGVEGMKIGGKRQLLIPPYLAYGHLGTETIPPNSTLIVDVELLGVQ
jgi:FKBP-type peptidyl-prolyl cis-trans isomerase